jgi:hypothetical protein
MARSGHIGAVLLGESEWSTLKQVTCWLRSACTHPLCSAVDTGLLICSQRDERTGDVLCPRLCQPGDAAMNSSLWRRGPKMPAAHAAACLRACPQPFRNPRTHATSLSLWISEFTDPLCEHFGPHAANERRGTSRARTDHSRSHCAPASQQHPHEAT